MRRSEQNPNRITKVFVQQRSDLTLFDLRCSKLLLIVCKARCRLRLSCRLYTSSFLRDQFRISVCVQPQTRVSRSSCSRDPPAPTHATPTPRSPPFTPSQLGALVLGEASLPLPGKAVTFRGSPLARWTPRRILSDTSSEDAAPAPRAQAPAKFPPERAARGVSCAGGVGTRRPGSRRPDAGRLRSAECSWATRLANLCCRREQLGAGGKRRGPRPPPRPPPVGPPAPRAAARALGPQKGSRTRRRRRRTYRAGSPAPPARDPAAAAASTEPRAHTALGQIQRSRARRRRRGSAEGAEWGRRGRGRGGERTASVTTSFRAHRPAAAGEGRGRGGQRARSANEFTFFFSPALSPSPSRRPLQPPPRPRGRARVLGSGPGIGIGRKEAASEEAEGKGDEASGAPCPGAASRTLTVWRGTRWAERAGAQARTRVRVCECGSEARKGEERRGAYHALPPVRIAGEPNPRASGTRLRSFIILDSFAPPLVKMTGVIHE
ncbi:uncharacterized protein V5649_009725 [Rhynchonycteris naso]